MKKNIKINEIIEKEASKLIYKRNPLIENAKQNLLDSLTEKQKILFSKYMYFIKVNNYIDKLLIVDFCIDFLKTINSYFK